MAPFGVYDVRDDLHLSFGSDPAVDIDIPAGRYEPATAEEAEACAHYAGVSFQPEGANESHPLLTLVEPPDTPEPDAEPPPADTPPADPAADQPPAPPPTAPEQTEPPADTPPAG